MKVSFDLDSTLYNTILNNGMDNGRSVAAEIRFQLKKYYEGDKK